MPEIKDSPAPFDQPEQPIANDADSPSGSGAATGPERKMIAWASRAVKDHISRQPHVQRLFSFMPTLMTRVSPFHFRNRNMVKDWPLVRLDSGEASAWGQMSVVGELLIIFDETVLFCLLALMKKYKSEAFETDEAEICSLAAVSATLANKVDLDNYTKYLVWRDILPSEIERVYREALKMAETGQVERMVTYLSVRE